MTFGYARIFDNAARNLCSRNGYDPLTFLSERQKEIRLIHEAHNVFAQTQRQNDIEWIYSCYFTISSTVSYAVVPTDESSLTPDQIVLLWDDIGRKLVGPDDNDELESYLHYASKSFAFLDSMKKEQLVEICKKFNRPHFGKRKAGIIEEIFQGPKERVEMNE